MISKGANFERYMQMPWRKKLTQAANDGTINPRADDAGNWDSGVIGVGKLLGTYRDISAVLAKTYYKREISVQDLRNIDYNEAKRIIKWIWDGIRAGEIQDQDVANITMHIKMHFGNIRLVQEALNNLGEKLDIDGTLGQKTLDAINRQIRKGPARLYNAIRAKLKAAYERSNPVYRKGFLNVLSDFPEKSTNKRYWATAAVIVLAVAAIIYAYKYFYKNGPKKA